MNSNFIKFLILFFSLNFTVSAGQLKTNTELIELQIRAGNFSKATEMIDDLINSGKLTETETCNLLFRKDQLNRIRIDFKLNEQQVKDQLKVYFPALTEKQLRRWENSNQLEMKLIDGKRHYFKMAVSNLFRLDSTASAVRTKTTGKPADPLQGFLKNHLTVLMDSFKNGNTKYTDQRKITLQYSMTLPADVVPPGETIRCWMPFPREDFNRQSNIHLNKINADHYIISPVENNHRTLYCEKVTREAVPTVFEMEVSFNTQSEWVNLSNKSIPSFDINSEVYKTNTAERPPHIIFSEQIKSLTNQIIGNETDAYRKVKLIYHWIGTNIPWCSALEYSTIDNIPEYVLKYRHGDCGMKTLLFMTMARYAGIPCRWQSGWMLHPVEVNLHDWCEVYYEGIGWVPLDQSFGEQKSNNESIRLFYSSGIDGYRFIVNNDFSQPLFPAKIFPRSETVDFQRGEMEWRGGNLYFDKWKYKMMVQYSR